VTFLVDGTWRHEKARIKLGPFGRLDKATRRKLDDEAERLAALHAKGDGALFFHMRQMGSVPLW
jgi:hypothetical protein